MSSPPNLYFRKEGIIYQVDVQEIVFIESHERCLHIHTLSERLEIPYITLKKVLNDIGEYGFVQCSRNTIVNRKYIAYIDKSNGYLGMKPNRQKIEIGLNFKQNI